MGKELEGLVDCIMSVITGETLLKKICVTNNQNLNIIFSGNIEASGTTVSGVFSAGEHYLKKFIKELFQKYDVIVCLSDDNDKKQVKEQIQALSDKGCNVLGVIINE